MRFRALVPALAAAVAGTVWTAFPAGAAAGDAPFAWGGIATYPANRTFDTYLYDRGVLSYTNRVGGATGANLDGKHREDYAGSVPIAGGTATYDAFGTHRLFRNGDYYPPTDDTRFPELSADVVFVQFHPSAAGLDVRIVFSSLGQRDSSIVTLALNLTGGRTGSRLPRNAVLACGGCGIDRYVTVWGTGSEIATATGAPLGTVVDLAADTTENTLSFRVPASLMPPLGHSMRAWLASGLHDGAGRYMTVQASGSNTQPGGGNGVATNVFDLAFVRENRATVDERVQADMLAAGDITAAAATIDLDLLRSGGRRLLGEPAEGPVERVNVSALNLGEGIDSGNGAATFQNPAPGDNMHYLGRLQPYLVQLPRGYRPDRAYPEVVVLHGYNGYYDEGYFLLPELRQALSEGGYIATYPLGRGDVQYEHDGELDVLEAMAGTAARYPIDRSRIYVTGLSMGGFGTTKMLTRHPDLFAAGAPYIGGAQQDVNVVNDRTTSYPLTRVYSPTIPNLQNTPLFIGGSAGDADPMTLAATKLYEQLWLLGDEVHLRTYLERSHEPSVMDDSSASMLTVFGWHRLNPVQPRLSYTFDTSWWFQGLVDDGAGWLRGLTPVGGGTQGTATAEAFTLPRQQAVMTEHLSRGGDPLARSAWTERDATARPVGGRPTANRLTLGLTKVATARTDLSQLRVDTGRRYCVDVNSDGAAAVTLTGLDFSRLQWAGAPAGLGAGGLTFRVPSGTTSIVLAPRGVDPAPGTACN